MSAKQSEQGSHEASAEQVKAGGAEAPLSAALTKEGEKADLGKRFIAFIIDAVLAFVVGFIPVIGGIIAAGYWLVRDGLEVDFMDHRSLGKKLMKLRPVTMSGKPLDIMDSVKRNWMFALGGVAGMLVWTIILIPLALLLGLAGLVLALIEAFLVLTDNEGKRLGDKIAGTKVVEVED